ncbi:uncharacterized protein FPRO_11041 [Fusarium proliferatum ET1]|uniref:Uncharacterized protein n=1 Tax=Fusarium proliferatum (strain ET1) TaxID=1227346 RepID=A0A1L7VMA0_FUSPR|nr:uncharacterized protein FPRO_11041 [Fusarium proliferatum ET1]CZR41452.1 uncharacterized protein FPRO_11041 [Fusarium proliferatum ET1]
MYTSFITTFVSTLSVRMGERDSLITTRVLQDEAIHSSQETHAWTRDRESRTVMVLVAEAHRADRPGGLHFALHLSPGVSQGMHYWPSFSRYA